jgi:hypothetical protein
VAIAKQETLKQKKARIKNDQMEKELWLSDIREVCKTTSGRKILWNIMGKCKFAQNIGAMRREDTERNVGKQEVGHWILDQIIEADENLFFKMMVESKEGEYNVRE